MLRVHNPHYFPIQHYCGRHYFYTLLSYNGYSLDKSTKKFDEIIDRAFKIGFGRDLAIDLIDFYNFEMLEKYGNENKAKNEFQRPSKSRDK